MIRLLRNLSRTERFAEPLKWLMSVPGIGQLTGMAFISEIDDISRFKNADQLASYIGMIPMCHSSGEHDGAGNLTLKAHSKLRCVLVEASWVAIRQDATMTQAYTEYCRRMKPSKAIIKIARRLVNRIYFVMKHKKEYVNNVA